MTTPETPQRIRIPDPTGDAFVDYLEIRIAQVLCRQPAGGHREDEGRQFAFAMGLATARWVYLLQHDIVNEIVGPVEFVAALKGRLATLSAQETGVLISIALDSANYAEVRHGRRQLRDLLLID